jgi:hypothetical protein
MGTDGNAALLAAIEEDHPCANTSCDIAAAAGQGYGYTAARLLMSATGEHAALTHLLGQRNPLVTVPLLMTDCPDWADWAAFHHLHKITCEECEAINYGDVGTVPYWCGNCMKPIRRESV